MRRRRGRAWQRWVSAVLTLVGLVLLGVWLGRIFMAFRSLQGHLAQAQGWLEEDPPELDASQVEALLHGTRQDIATLRGDGAPLLWAAPALGWLPGRGGDVAMAPALLEMADALSEAALLSWDGLAPLLEKIQGGKNPQGQSLLVALAGQLTEARPALARAQSALAQARAARGRLDPSRLSPTLQRIVAHLDEAAALLEEGLKVTVAAPVLLGVEKEYTYLILAQNEDELRATGGFLTGYGLVTVRRGVILRASFDNSYSADDFRRPYPDAPLPMRRFMGITSWVFRDSNWSPDFPTAARQAIELFRPATPVTIDGVIALDQEVLRRLVAAAGPVSVSGQALDEANIIAYIRSAWAPAGGSWTPEEWQQRKEFMGEVATAILDRLQKEAGDIDWLALGTVVRDLVEEKHLLVFLPQPPEMADLLARKGWDGSLRPFAGDSLLVVDSNVGYNKVNPLIEEGIVYQADLAAAPPAVTVTLHYTHTGQPLNSPCRPQVVVTPVYEGMMKGCYWDYLRLYVPAGSSLRGGQVPSIPVEEVWSGEAISMVPTLEPPEFGRQVFSAALVVPPGETRSLFFSYDLPSVLRFEDGQWHYCLLVQKQPGTRGHRVTVVLKLPPQADATACKPSPCPSVTPLVFRLTLDRDQEVQVVYRTP